MSKNGQEIMMSFTTDRDIWSLSWQWKIVLWEFNFTHWLV